MSGTRGRDLPAVPTPAAEGVRRFRDEEVEAILRRAASREARPDLPAPHDPTLRDLMAAAAEAGLDPAEVRRAAALLPPAPAAASTALLGAPDRREAVLVLEGGRLAADPHALARAAERLSGSAGRIAKGKRAGFAWAERHLGGGTSFSAVETGGALEVRVSAERGGIYAGLWFTGLLAWAAVSALTPLGALPLLAKVAGFLLVPPLLARPVWTASDRRLRARVERMALEFARVAEAPGAPGPGGAAGLSEAQG